MDRPIPRADGLIVSLRHIACAVTVMVAAYIMAGFIGDGVVAVASYVLG